MLAMARGAVIYLGPEHAVSKQGSWFISATTSGAYQLVRSLDGELRALSNVCPHYHKQIRVPKYDWSDGYNGVLEGGHTTCGGHLWSWDDKGVHVGPNERIIARGAQCTHLSTELTPEVIGGLVWAGSGLQRDGLRTLLSLDLTRQQGITHYVPANYRLFAVRVLHDPFSAYAGMRIYEDLNHPGKGVHRGKLDSVVDMRNPLINYDAKHGVSIQTVPWLEHVDPAKLSVHWHEYHCYAREVVEEKLVPDDDANGDVCWLAHYPSFFTHERYRFMRVNSWFLPKEDGTVCNVIEFYFPEEVLGFKLELAEAALAAYMGGMHDNTFVEGIAQEDARLALECDRGMDRLVEMGRGDRVAGPFDPVADKAVANFDSFFGWRWEEYKRRKGALF
jgi:hypothetical protein